MIVVSPGIDDESRGAASAHEVRSEPGSQQRLRRLLSEHALPARTALLVIDMQVDFADPNGRLYVAGSKEVVETIAKLLRLWRAADQPIVHVVRLYRANGSNAEPARRSLLERIGGAVMPGSPGSRIVEPLLQSVSNALPADLIEHGATSIGRREWVLYKPRWGAFYQTCLSDLLQTEGAEGVVICGCNLPNCPRATAFEASERDYVTAVIGDATSQATPDRLMDFGLIGVKVLDSGQLLGGE